VTTRPTGLSAPGPAAAGHAGVLVAGAGISGIGTGYRLKTRLAGTTFSIVNGRQDRRLGPGSNHQRRDRGPPRPEVNEVNGAGHLPPTSQPRTRSAHSRAAGCPAAGKSAMSTITCPAAETARSASATYDPCSGKCRSSEVCDKNTRHRSPPPGPATHLTPYGNPVPAIQSPTRAPARADARPRRVRGSARQRQARDHAETRRTPHTCATQGRQRHSRWLRHCGDDL
jgi:hypothetical protein